MRLCQFRAERECACATNECRATPKQTQAPLIFISWRTQAVTCLFIGFFVTIISAAVMETQVKKRDLINQEQATTWKR